MVPSVTAIDYKTGYATGGQVLTITGTSLDGTDIKVKVDGEVCDVQTIEQDQITCITRSKVLPAPSSQDEQASDTTDSSSDSDETTDASAETDTSNSEGGRLLDDTPTATDESTESAPTSFYIGQMGLHRYYFSNTSGIGHTNWLTFIETEQLSDKMLWTSPEVVAQEIAAKRFYGFRAYFKAPTTGEYRFLMACDDTCMLSLSVTQPRLPEAKEQLLARNGWVRWRTMDFIEDKTENSPKFGQLFSKWLTLQKDEYYYFETSVLDTGGALSHTIGMEVKPETMPAAHPKMDAQIQIISLGQSDLKWDKLQIRVEQPDQGDYILMYMDPRTSEWAKSGILTSGCSADEMQ